MCFLAAGMGGGTGTGAAPVIAKAARDMGILTVGVVTKPFAFEGKRRAQSAEAGIEELQKYVDTLIVIPNQNLFLVASANTTFKQAFEMADEVLQQGVRGITDLMVMPGLINLDFADVRSVMQEMGKAMMGTGEAEGDNRAIQAAEQAIANLLLDGVSLNGAKGVIVSITGGEDMRLMEVDEAANHIRELVDTDANIIFGSAFNAELEGKILVSVVATGIEASEAPAAAPAAEAPRTFSFGGPRRVVAEPTPAAEMPATAAIEPAPLPETASPLGQGGFGQGGFVQGAAPAPADPAAAAPTPAAFDPSAPVAPAGNGDELVLGSDTMVPEPAPQGGPAEPAALPPEPTIRRRWLTGEPDAEPAAAAPDAPPAEEAPRRSGGTLFERMASATRANRDGGDDRDPPDIPRFLHRQNNQ